MTSNPELHASGIEPDRARMFGNAYRLLGNVHDAEDIVPEAALRWHQSDLARMAWLALTNEPACACWSCCVAESDGVPRIAPHPISRPMQALPRYFSIGARLSGRLRPLVRVL